VYVAASCSFVNQWTVAAGGDVVRDYGGGCKHFLIGVVAQVCERWEVCAGIKRLRSLRRMNAARRWRPRSDAPAKPHQALEACVNLAMTTEWKIVCSETSSMPWARKTLRAYKVCALELITA